MHTKLTHGSGTTPRLEGDSYPRKLQTAHHPISAWTLTPQIGSIQVPVCGQASVQVFRSSHCMTLTPADPSKQVLTASFLHPGDLVLNLRHETHQPADLGSPSILTSSLIADGAALLRARIQARLLRTAHHTHSTRVTVRLTFLGVWRHLQAVPRVVTMYPPSWVDPGRRKDA